MTSAFRNGNFLRGLAFRVLLFLSLAMLPIGLISFVQTREIADQAVVNANLSLLAITEQSTTRERTILQEAFGAADALSTLIGLIRDDSHACSAFLRRYLEETGTYDVVSFIRIDGQTLCSSAGRTLDYSQHPVFKMMADRKERMAYVTDTPVAGQGKVILVTVPLRFDNEVIGFVGMSINNVTLEDKPALPPGPRPVAMLTFNAHGEILTTERGPKNAMRELPSVNELRWYVGQSGQVFQDTNSENTERFYAVLPIVPGAVYAMSVWPTDSPLLQAGISNALGLMLPILMWIASLIVAFWALNRLAINHIRKLGRQMRHFALNRTLPRTRLAGGVPTEIVDMEAAFVGMADSILKDEATLEDNLRQKNILLKEVHHRVKNNLQLISSIMNMQIRQAKTEDARRVLQRLQERILSLATVHKNLYQNDNLTRVDGGALTQEIVNQLLSVGLSAGAGVKVVQRYEPVQLDPDDAAPLTLLVSEAVANALKHVIGETSQNGRLDISLTSTGPEMALFTISNTIGKSAVEAGTGLGSRLINAFARQLNGEVEIFEEEGLYRLSIAFPVPLNIKQVYDY
jgi:two-component sensor histidine kinase